MSEAARARVKSWLLELDIVSPEAPSLEDFLRNLPQGTLRALWNRLQAYHKFSVTQFAKFQGIRQVRFSEWLNGVRDYDYYRCIVIKALLSESPILFAQSLNKEQCPLFLEGRRGNILPPLPPIPSLEVLIFIDHDNQPHATKALQALAGNSVYMGLYVLLYSSPVTNCKIDLPWIHATYGHTRVDNSSDVEMAMDIALIDRATPLSLPFVLVSHDKFVLEVGKRIGFSGRRYHIIDNNASLPFFLVETFPHLAWSPYIHDISLLIRGVPISCSVTDIVTQEMSRIKRNESEHPSLIKPPRPYDNNSDELLSVLRQVKDMLTREICVTEIARRISLTKEQRAVLGTWKRIMMAPFTQEFLNAQVVQRGDNIVVIPNA